MKGGICLSIKKEQEVKNKIEAKGYFRGVDREGLLIEDEKTSLVETIRFDDLNMFKDCLVKISFSDTVKSEIKGE